MADDTKTSPKPGRKAHTELRRQGEKADQEKTERDEARTPLKPRTPVDRLPLDGDEDDLFNDMPV